MKILLGCDPELFVFNKDNKPVSAHGLIPGTKLEPFKVNTGAIQVDGMAVEFNIDPASSEQEWVDNIANARSALDTRLEEQGLNTKAVPVVNFSKSIIKASPKEALELGCEPDFNAYTKKVNPTPKPEDPTFRTASGHIHIGWTEDVDPLHPEHLEACRMFAKHLDYFLAWPLLAVDKDQTRRTLYGKAGCFRPKSYGMEYRTLSNVWLTDEKLIRWVYSTTIKAFEDLANGVSPEKLYGELCLQFINYTGNHDEANELILRKAKRMSRILEIQDPSEL